MQRLLELCPHVAFSCDSAAEVSVYRSTRQYSECVVLFAVITIKLLICILHIRELNGGPLYCPQSSTGTFSGAKSQFLEEHSSFQGLWLGLRLPNLDRYPKCGYPVGMNVLLLGEIVRPVCLPLLPVCNSLLYN